MGYVLSSCIVQVPVFFIFTFYFYRLVPFQYCSSLFDFHMSASSSSPTGVQYQKQHGIVAVLPFPSATFARPTGSWDRCLAEPSHGATGLTAMRIAPRGRSPSLLSLIGYNDLPSLQLSGRRIRMYPQLWGTFPPSAVLSMIPP